MKLVQRVTVVAGLFEKFALCALLERFARLAVAARKDPQTRVGESRLVVPMLEQRRSIGSQQGDAADARLARVDRVVMHSLPARAGDTRIPPTRTPPRRARQTDPRSRGRASCA